MKYKSIIVRAKWLFPVTIGVAAGIFSSGCTVNLGGAGANTTTNTSQSVPSGPASNSPAATNAAPKASAPDRPAAPAQKDAGSERSVRVSFAKGETSGSMTQTIPANGTVNFLVNARSGQLLEFTVGYDFSESDLSVYLSEPGAQEFTLAGEPKKREEFSIKKSGDHTIVVSNTSPKPATITLYVDIAN